MKKYIFDNAKNLKLKHERDVSFEDVIKAIEENKVVDIFKHHNKEKYPLQEIMLVEIKGYIWEIPFLDNGDSLILKTAYPSRKANQKYLKIKSEENTDENHKL